MSLLLHGSLLAAALLLLEPKPGAAPAQTEAITVEIVPSDVLEAARTSPSPAAARSDSFVESDPGAIEDVAAAPSERPDAIERAHEQAPAADQAIDAPDDRPGDGEVAVDALDQAHEPAEATFKPSAAGIKEEDVLPSSEAARKPVETTTKAVPPQPRSAQKAPMRKGGALSRATKASTSSAARVSASPGSAINYAALVRARVASRKPPGPGKRGTVVVTFGVSRSGGLAFASILRSSGDAELDRTVLSAVRSAAPFPPPPEGASLRQRQFSMPFDFR
ncbi:MAG: cell envelope integrity protein TolA [Hyphomicrobiaceae bacterium]